jgi:hypothetical protein
MPLVKLEPLVDRLSKYHAHLVIRSIMMWPDDEERRREFVASGLAVNLHSLERLDRFIAAAASTSNSESQQRAISLVANYWRRFSEAGGFNAVARAPGSDYFESEWKNRLGHWFTAGLILKMIRQMAIHHTDLPGGPSVNKAVYVLEHVPYPRVPRNSHDIRAAWSTYKSVAHFCAAYFELYLPLIAQGADIQYRKLVPVFLSEAAAYQDFGISFIPPRSTGKPILDPAITWTLPDDRPWFYPTKPPPPFDETVMAAVKGYRAPVSSY